MPMHWTPVRHMDQARPTAVFERMFQHSCIREAAPQWQGAPNEHGNAALMQPYDDGSCSLMQPCLFYSRPSQSRSYACLRCCCRRSAGASMRARRLLRAPHRHLITSLAHLLCMPPLPCHKSRVDTGLAYHPADCATNERACAGMHHSQCRGTWLPGASALNATPRVRHLHRMAPRRVPEMHAPKHADVPSAVSPAQPR